MHRVLVKNADYEIAWIDGCQCLLAGIRNGKIGREGVEAFFRELKDARNNLRASALALDLRAAHRLPDDIWDWLQETWYPRMMAQGLRRQAMVWPKELPARIQWRGLKAEGLEREEFDKLPAAIHWLGKTDFDSTPTRRRVALVGSGSTR